MASVTIVDRPEAQFRISKSRQRPKQRWMLPREHGAYAAFLFPVLTVLAAGRPTLEGWLLIFASCAFFLAHEPMLVVLGLRGSRVKRERGTTARGWLVLYGFAALVLGVTGLWIAAQEVQYAAMVPLVFALMAFMLSGEGLGKTPPGQAVIAIALALVALPVGLACGLSFATSICVVGVWALVGMLGTSVVRLTLDRTKLQARPDDLARAQWRAAATLGVSLVVIGAAVAAPVVDRLPLWVLAAAWPTAIAAALILLVGPQPGRLRTIGWTLVGANVCTWLGVVGVLRLLAGVDAFWNAVSFPYF